MVANSRTFPVSALLYLSFWVAKLAKSFGWLGLAESLGDFRYEANHLDKIRATGSIPVEQYYNSSRVIGPPLFVAS
jgi:hypothetical protein